METDRLRYFCTIAETGSLTKAADLLSISHSGLSKAISALENELGQKLFQPHGRGLEITTDGKRLYPQALEVLQAVGRLSTKRSEPAMRVRIGLSEVIAVSAAALIAEEFSDRLDLIQIDVGELEGRILAGELDFGVAFVPSPKPEMDYLKIADTTLAAFGRRELLRKSSVPFAVPATEVPDNPMNFKHRDGWPLDQPRDARFRVSSLAIAMTLVRASKAAIYIPEFAARLDGKLEEIEDFKAARTRRSVFLVKSKSSEETLEMKKTAKVIRTLCR